MMRTEYLNDISDIKDRAVFSVVFLPCKSESNIITHET